MVLFVNACVERESSRTYRLAQALLAQWPAEAIEEVILESENLVPLNTAALKRRKQLVAENNLAAPEFKYARQFSQADLIVIAAPYWDLQFPALLKCYLEAIMIKGLTFRYGENGQPQGLCQAQKLYYVTTSGGYIGEFNLGYDYLKSLCLMYGIPAAEFISAQGLDIWGQDTEKILQEAIAKLAERSGE